MELAHGYRVKVNYTDGTYNEFEYGKAKVAFSVVRTLKSSKLVKSVEIEEF